MTQLVPVAKDGEYLEVHETCLAAHVRLGWTPCAKQAPATDEGEGEATGTAGAPPALTVSAIREALTAKGVAFDPALKKPELLALLQAQTA